MSQSKNWVFTLNNYSEDEESELQVSHDCVSYIIFGKEVGDSGTPHLQGYIEFNKNMTLIGIKRLFKSDRFYLAKRLGTSEDAANYCRKGSDIYERGIMKKPRLTKTTVKNKLLEFIPDIRKTGLREFSNDPNCNLSMLKHAEKWVSLNMSPRKITDPLVVYWFYGETGCGKTWRAYNESVEAGCEPYIRSGNGRFFDGYTGQSHVIFDDFREDDIPFNMMLRLLDKYPVSVEIKGSVMQWKPRVIYITSPLEPKMTFTKNSYYGCLDNIQQLLRRLTDIVEIKPPQTPQGGLKRDDSSFDLVEITPPPRSCYPVLPPLQTPPRALGTRRLPEVLLPGVSPTQEWPVPE